MPKIITNPLRWTLLATLIAHKLPRRKKVCNHVLQIETECIRRKFRVVQVRLCTYVELQQREKGGNCAEDRAINQDCTYHMWLYSLKLDTWCLGPNHIRCAVGCLEVRHWGVIALWIHVLEVCGRTKRCTTCWPTQMPSLLTSASL